VQLASLVEEGGVSSAGTGSGYSIETVEGTQDGDSTLGAASDRGMEIRVQACERAVLSRCDVAAQNKNGRGLIDIGRIFAWAGGERDCLGAGLG
jgi:hypothetical protein